MVSSLTVNQTHGLIDKLLDRITELKEHFNQHSGKLPIPTPVMGLEVLRRVQVGRWQTEHNYVTSQTDRRGRNPVLIRLTKIIASQTAILKQAKSTVIIDEYLLQ
ncbi:hypothetical protein [Aeromonas allosaccharophila]|uniref:hypothetical protein n=1 Tax=Aeromonas allosaccharophila TaxID=656 RepID=UPI00300545CF